MSGIAADGRGPGLGLWLAPACAWALAAGIFAGCGSRRDGDSPTEKQAAAAVTPAGRAGGQADGIAGAATAAAGATLPVADSAPLGVASLDALLWRERGGQEAFEKARAGERRGDWAKMVAHCQEALAADPSHLEASWLLAAGLAHLGRFAEVTAPLAAAVAGDPGKWAQPALELSLFAPYWKSGQGDRLAPWIASVQRRFAAAVAGSLIAAQKGKLLAYDRAAKRWLPLSRRLALAGALVGSRRVVYLARGEISAAARAKAAKAAAASAAAELAAAKPGEPDKADHPLRPSRSPKPPRPPKGSNGAKAAVGKAAASEALWLVGFIDRATGAAHEVQLPPASRYTIVERSAPAATAATAAKAGGQDATANDALWVRADSGPWLALSAEDRLVPAAAPPATAAPRLVFDGTSVQVERLLVSGARSSLPGIAADWDQSAMASALRLRRSNRLVALPAPALIDGHRVQWSPSSSRLALVASLESCERDQPAVMSRRTLAYVVDPITGSARELAQSAADLELTWLSDSLLAVATERGLELFDVTGGSAELLGADLSLPMPLRSSRCPKLAPLDLVEGEPDASEAPAEGPQERAAPDAAAAPDDPDSGSDLVNPLHGL